jgi:hypothetical protein
MQVFDSYADLIRNHEQSYKSIDTDVVFDNVEIRSMNKLSGALSRNDITALAHSVWHRYPAFEVPVCVALVSNLTTIRHHSVLETKHLVSWKGYTQLLLCLKQKLTKEDIDKSVLTDFGHVNLIIEMLLAAKANLLRAKEVVNGQRNRMVERVCVCTKEIVGLIITMHRNLVSPIQEFEWNSTLTLLFEVSDLVSSFMSAVDVVRYLYSLTIFFGFTISQLFRVSAKFLAEYSQLLPLSHRHIQENMTKRKGRWKIQQA